MYFESARRTSWPIALRSNKVSLVDRKINKKNNALVSCNCTQLSMCPLWCPLLMFVCNIIVFKKPALNKKTLSLDANK